MINSDANIARPNFPGLETVFGISINFDNIIQIDIKDNDIEKYLRYTDSHQRVHNWVNLYVDPLIAYSEKEEMPVDIWFIVIPESIYQFGRPNSKIPKSAENINIGLKKQERKFHSIGYVFPRRKRTAKRSI